MMKMKAIEMADNIKLLAMGWKRKGNKSPKGFFKKYRKIRTKTNSAA